MPGDVDGRLQDEAHAALQDEDLQTSLVITCLA